MPNPYINSNTPSIVPSYFFEDVTITSDYTFPTLPRAIYVSNATTSLHTLTMKPEGAGHSDATIVVGPGGMVLPVAPEIIRANANLTVMAMY